jgi:CubicO group peptidase (beta-lactamase class C family)
MSLTRGITIAASILFLFVTPAAAEQPWQGAVDALVAETMAEKHIPGLSVAIVSNGEVIFEQGYGLSNVEMEIAANANTVYPISSVSKIFAGLVAMGLVVEGKLDLDVSILQYLPQLPAEYAPITVRHLLSHTHGLKDTYHTQEWDDLPEHQIAAMTGEDIMLWNAPRPFEFQPGEDWAYSLLGYVILQRALETIEGKSYEAIVQERILDPLQMTSSVYGGTKRVIAGRHPVLYEWVEGKLVNHHVKFPDISYSAGGLNTSVVDFATFFAAIEAGDVLPQEALWEIWTPYPVVDSEMPFYGLGWMAYRRPSTGRYIVGHEGGGNAWVYYWPEEHLAVIALSNMSLARADLLPHEIADIILTWPDHQQPAN